MDETRKDESLGEKLQTIIDNLPPGGVTLAAIREIFLRLFGSAG